MTRRSEAQAGAAEIMPYPNPELGNHKDRGMIGTGHLVREVEKSMAIYRRLKPEYDRWSGAK